MARRPKKKFNQQQHKKLKMMRVTIACFKLLAANCALSFKNLRLSKKHNFPYKMNAKDHIAVKLSSLTPQVLQSLKQFNFLVIYLGGSKNRPNWGFLWRDARKKSVTSNNIKN